jgi:hypothetical protein
MPVVGFGPRCIRQSVKNCRIQAHKGPARRLPGGLVGGLLALEQPHVGGLGALRPLHHVELDHLPVVK